MTILSASRRHASRFTAGNGTPLQLRARGLLEELFPPSSEAVEPLFTPEQVRELQLAAQAAEDAAAAAAVAAAAKAGKRKGRKRKADSRLQRAGSAAPTAAAAAAAVAALRASASSPALLDGDGSSDPEDNIGLMSDLLLPDDPHLVTVLGPDLAADTAAQPPPAAAAPAGVQAPPAAAAAAGVQAPTADAAAAASKAAVDPQQQQASPSGVAAAATAAGAAPATEPAVPLSSTEQQQQQQQSQSDPALVLPATRAESGALLLSSPAAAEAGSSSPTTEPIITKPFAAGAAGTDGTDGKLQPSAPAAAEAAGDDDDLMAVDRILADLEEDGMLGSSSSQQLLHAPGQETGFSFQALLLSGDDNTAERLTAAAHTQLLLPASSGQGLHSRLLGPGPDLLQLQGSTWPPPLSRAVGDPHPSSRTTADFLTSQQQQTLLSVSQQEAGVPAEASDRALERSARKERKRLKKLLKQMQQQQQQGGAQPFPTSHHQSNMLGGPFSSSNGGGASMQPPFMPPPPGIPPHLSYQLQQQGQGIMSPAAPLYEAPGVPGPWGRHPGSSSSSFGRLTPNVLASAVAADLANHGWPPPRLRTAGGTGQPCTSTLPPSAAAGAGLLERHPAAAAAARFAPYSLPPVSNSSRHGLSSMGRRHLPPSPASLGRAASFSGFAQPVPSAVDAGDSGSLLPAAAATAAGFGRSQSLPGLLLAGVPVGEEAAAEAVGSQHLEILQGTPVGTARPAAAAAVAVAAAAGSIGGADGDAGHGPVESSGAGGAAGAHASHTEDACLNSANDPTTAARPVLESNPDTPAAAAAAKDLPALTSPQGASPSGSCSTSNILTAAGTALDTHNERNMHPPWQQPMHMQQQQQQQQQDPLSHLFPPQQWTAQQHTPPTAASQGLMGGLNPWPHLAVSSKLNMQQQQQQQQQMLSPQAAGLPLAQQLSASDATLLAAAAAAGMPPPHSFASPTAPGQQQHQQQQQQQQQNSGQKRKGRGRAAGGASGSAYPEVVNGGMDLAASSRLLRTSSGKVLRMLTHPVTGKPLLLGPAVDAKTSRLGNTTLGAPAPQLFGHNILHSNRVQQPSTAAPPPPPPPQPQAAAGPGYPAHSNSYQQSHLQPWMGPHDPQRSISSSGGYGAWNPAAAAAAADAGPAAGGMSGFGQYAGLPGLSHLQPQLSPTSADAQAYADTLMEFAGPGATSGYGQLQPGLPVPGGMFGVGMDGHQGWEGRGRGGHGVDFGGLQLPDPAAAPGAYMDDGLAG